jgi:hypothetical protein
MTPITRQFYQNLVTCLSAVSGHPMYQSLLDWHFLVLPIIPALFIFAGMFLGVRTERVPRAVFYSFLTCFIAAFVVSGIWVYVTPAPFWIGLVFYAAFSFALAQASYRAGVGLRLLSHGPLAIYIILATVLVSFFFILFSNNLPTLPSSKEDLKKTFRTMSGRDPGADEKKAFWKATVGEEDPSQEKRDDHWGGKK